MGAGGDLGHDSAVARVQVGLSDHHRGQDVRCIRRTAQDCRRRVVTARFKAKDEDVFAQGGMSDALSGGWGAGNTPPDG